MRILGKNRLYQSALVALALVAMANSDVMAWSYGSYGSAGSYGGSAGSYGSTGSYGSSGSYASYGCSGCYGSYGGGLFSRMRARRAARIAARSCYGCYGCYGSTGGYVVAYSSQGCYGSYGCSGSYGGATYGTPVEVYDTPTEYSEPTEAPIEAPAVAEPAAENSAAINVTLPVGAKVFVNGVLTTSTGSSRSYVSKGLQQGRSYSYQLRVEFERDGEKVVEQKAVKLSLGDKVELNFGNDDQNQIAAAEESVKTVLNVTVPAGAKVFLSGAATKQSGEERSYITQRLTAGEQWDGYTVRVEFEQDGKTLVQERELSIEGGESYELAFDFAQQETLQIAQVD